MQTPLVRRVLHVYHVLLHGLTRFIKGFLDPYFSQRTVEKLIDNVTTSSSSATSSKVPSLTQLAQSASNTHLVDILISHAWPAAISATCPMPSAAQPPVPALDEVVRKAKPKYYFAVGGGTPPQFWEREPFVWEEANGRVTRFVSLGTFGGEHGTEKKPRVSSQPCVVFSLLTVF